MTGGVKLRSVMKLSTLTAWTPLAMCVIALTGCTSMTGPSAKGPTVNSISPSSGTTLGGTVVTILGGGFASGVTVTLGGVAATGVTVSGTTMLTATTGQHASGTVDVVVSLGGGSTTLTGAFAYVAPPTTTNTPPTITSLMARGTRANEPAGYADAGETLQVVATVTDAETAPASLTYGWTSDQGGAFSGTGSTVTWTAPLSVATPVAATLTLTVTETYDTIGPNGLPAKAEHVVAKTVPVSLHDAVAEVGSMAAQFLEDFSDSSITSVDYVLRNFTDTCSGKADEASDVASNRAHYTITAHHVGAPAVTVGFGGTCPFRSRTADACAQVPVTWTSTSKDDGTSGTVAGTDQVTAVYLAAESAWRLCGSDFNGAVTSGAMRGFIR